MTSLREEIITIIEDHLQGNETGIIGQEESADDILKLIEKRLDSIRLPQIENGIYTKPQLEYLAVCIMDDVKRELLK